MGTIAKSKIRPLATTEVMTITPGTAKKWLAANTDAQRPLSQYTVERYAREMKEGQWVINGESIKFNTSGSMIDGQHRLHACIQANRSFDTLIVTNLPEEAFKTLDRGKQRGAADLLAMRGEQQVTLLATCLSYLGKLDEYGWGGIVFSNSGRILRPEPHTIVDVVLPRHPGIRESLHVWSKLRGRLPPSIASTLHYLFAQRNLDQANAFFQHLAELDHSGPGDPIALLNKRLVENMRAQSKLRSHHLAAITIKAWNWWRAGENERRVLMYREDEAFPKIK
jgi:hypothetical protein